MVKWRPRKDHVGVGEYLFIVEGTIDGKSIQRWRIIPMNSRYIFKN
jgi:hypothetical protein